MTFDVKMDITSESGVKLLFRVDIYMSTLTFWVTFDIGFNNS